jgi:hypothetical protein
MPTTINGVEPKFGRVATKVLAPSNAPILSKLQADYICPGASDEDIVNNAINSCIRTVASENFTIGPFLHYGAMDVVGAWVGKNGDEAVAQDLIDKIQGTASIKVTGGATDNPGMKKTGLNLNWTNYTIATVWAKTDLMVGGESIVMRLVDTDGDWWEWTAGIKGRHYGNDTWAKLEFDLTSPRQGIDPQGGSDPDGTFDRSKVAEIWLYVVAEPTGVVMRFDSFCLTNWNPLANKQIHPSSQVIKNAADAVTYTEGTDYEIDFLGGKIRGLAVGTMVSGSTNHANYNWGGGTVLVLDGKLECNGDIIPKPFVKVKGLGSKQTIFNFTNSGKVALDTYEYCDIEGFTVTGAPGTGFYGAAIYQRKSHFKAKDIVCYDLEDNAYAAFAIRAINGEVLEDLEYIDCHAIDCDRFGWLFIGSIDNYVQDVLMDRVSAVNCGRYGRYATWITGFDFYEDGYGCRNFIVSNAVADRNWESGFHIEGCSAYPTEEGMQGIQLINPRSAYNGIDKPHTYYGGYAAHRYFGSGYWLVGNVQMVNSYSEGNAKSGVALSNANHDEAIAMIINHVDRWSAIGLKIVEQTAGKIQVRNFLSYQPRAMGLYIDQAQDFDIDIRVEDPQCADPWQPWCNQIGYSVALYAQRGRIRLSGTNKSGYTWCAVSNNCDDLDIEGNVKIDAASGYSLGAVGVIRFHELILRFSGASFAGIDGGHWGEAIGAGISVYNTRIEKLSGTLDYGVVDTGAGSGNINVNRATTKIIGATTAFGGCKFDEKSGTATVVATNTSVVVTHGLTTTPTRVQLTPTTDTGGKRYWVSAKGATTFTITIDSALGTDITFDWRAETI